MRSLRICLINPPSPPGMNVARDYAGGYGTAISSTRTCYGADEAYMCMPYVSLLSTAAVLENRGHEVAFIDGQAEGLTDADVAERILSFNPSLVVGAVNLPSIEGDLALYRLAREQCESTLFCAVGTVCKGIPDDVLQGDIFDAAVVSDPEVVIVGLSDALSTELDWHGAAGIKFRAGDTVVSSPAAERLSSLDAIGMPAYHLAPMHLYTHNLFGKHNRYSFVLSSKGCASACAYYCPYPYGFGRRIVFYSPEKVVDMITLLAGRYGARDLIFRDQTFTLSRPHAEAICNLLIERDPGVEWLCETRIDCLDKPLLQKMRAAGCRQINLGLEAADASVLNRLGKPGCSYDQAAKAIEWARNAGIKVHFHTIVGWPDDDVDTSSRWIKLLKRFHPDRVGVSVLTPYPGTPLRLHAEREGLIETSNWAEYTGFRPVMRTRHLTLRDISELRESIICNWNEPGIPGKIVRKSKMVMKMFKQAACKDK